MDASWWRYLGVRLSTDRPIHTLDGAGLSREYAAGVLSAVDVLARVQDAIDRFSDRFSLLDAVADWESIYDSAGQSDLRWAEGKPRSPLDGVPFAVQANIAMAGLPWRGGIEASARQVATEDSAIVAVLRAAGMIPVGVLSMQTADSGEADANRVSQRTRNPHDPRRIAGRSSSGCAAAVALGVIPIALGTDTMGGVRLPSALCGVVGFKPALGVFPVEGLHSLSPTLGHVGIHARSVADVRSVLRLFVRNAISRRQPERTLSWQVSDELRFDADVSRVFSVATQALEPMCSLDWRDVDLAALRRASLLCCVTSVAAQSPDDMATDPGGYSEAFESLLAWRTRQSADALARSESLLAEVGARLREELNGAVVVSPTSPNIAPSWDVQTPQNLADMTIPAAIAGLPSISIPAETDGLPVGLQITGGDYLEVLTLAQMLFPGVADVASQAYGEADTADD